MTNATIERQTSTEPVELSREIAYAIFQSERHEAAARNTNNTPEEQREHKHQTRSIDKAVSEMLRGNIPQSANIPGARGMYFVRSRSTSGIVYRVSTRGGSCTCEARGDCWHMSAALILEEVAEGEDALAAYLSLRASVIAGDEESEPHLHALGAHPYIEYIRRQYPERLRLPALESTPEPDALTPEHRLAAKLAAIEAEPLEQKIARSIEWAEENISPDDLAEIVGADEQDEPIDPYSEHHYERVTRYQIR